MWTAMLSKKRSCKKLSGSLRAKVLGLACSFSAVQLEETERTSNLNNFKKYVNKITQDVFDKIANYGNAVFINRINRENSN